MAGALYICSQLPHTRRGTRLQELRIAALLLPISEVGSQ